MPSAQGLIENLGLEEIQLAARAATDRCEWEAAASLWQKIRQLQPECIPAYVVGADVLFRASRHAEADDVSREATLRFPESAWAAHMFANLAGRRNDWHASRLRWESVRDRFPTDVSGYANGAVALIRLGALNEAAVLLQWATEHYPDNPDAWIHLATLAGAAGNWDLSASRCEELRKRFPQIVAGYALGVQAEIFRKASETAEALAQEGYKKFPDDLWMAHIYAGLPGRFGDPRTSADRWGEIRKRFPDDPQGYELGGLSLSEAGRHAEAEDVLVEAQRRFPPRASVLAQIAEIYMARSLWALALEKWADMRRQFPDDARAYVRAVRALHLEGRSQDAIDLINSATAVFPNSVDVALLSLEQELDCGLTERAWAQWDRCMSVNATLNSHFYTLTWRLYQSNPLFSRSSEALDLLLNEPIHSHTESVPSLVRGLGWMLRLPGEPGYKMAWEAVSKRLISLRPVRERQFEQTLRVLMGFEADLTAISSLLGSMMASRQTKLARIVCSTLFSNGQARATGIDSRTGECLKGVLGQMYSEFERDVERISAHAAYNALYFSYVCDLQLFTRLVSLLSGKAHSLCCTSASNMSRGASETAVWFAIDAICSGHEKKWPTGDKASGGVNVVTSVGDRPMRIALCVSGQLRGFRAAKASWDALGLSDHDVTTVVHVWRNVGRQAMALASTQRGFPAGFVEKYNSLVNRVGSGTLRSKFPGFYSALEPRLESCYADLEDCYQTEHISIDDDATAPFVSMSGPEKMYYKIEQAHQRALLVRNDFDLMIRIRPDKKLLKGEHIDWSRIHHDSVSDNCVFVDDVTHITQLGDIAVGDQFAVGCKEAIGIYCKTWSFTKPGTNNFYGFDSGYAGHVNLAQTLLFHGVPAKQMRQLRFGAMFDPPRLSSEQLRDVVLNEIGGEPRDDIEKLFLSAVLEI